MDEQSFGNAVQQRRREMDLTQEELARRVGCAAITVRKIEAGDARPSVQIAERLAMALAIPLDQRADFIRRARAAQPAPDAPTPAPRLDEIGSEDLSGRAIRGYALAEKIGAGGMGAVYRAVQPLVEREVAIKIILPGFANHPDFIRRFESEAQLVARLEHPHIVPLYDYWREPGVAYLVMRLLRGGSLQGLLREGPLPMLTISRVVEQICQSLHAAHRIGIIHRDLKPANILLDEDQNAYLADFGIAKNLGNPDISNETELGMMIGSPNYMSPEQIQALPVQPQTDIYCLGVMLYEMLTGKLPFNGPTPFDLIQQHISRPIPLLAEHTSGLPAGLDTVLWRATAKASEERYDTSMALWSDFQQAIGGMTSQPILILDDQPFTGELVNPYKGLRAFNEADADDFFGRETLVQQLLGRMSAPSSSDGELLRFLAVLGPSGSGKSSVVKAGLIPALRRGGLLGAENWFYVELLPGPHPFEELEAALLRVAVNPPPSLLEQLKNDSRGLLRATNRILPADPRVELVLVIDQFEELFTLVESEDERALLLNSLVTACLDERSRIRIIITLRADFMDRPLRYVDFGEMLQRRNELVLPLTPDELERAILGPAHRVGLKIENGLIAAMIRDVGSQVGALPLLQYALTELFELREGNLVTKAAYQSIGGVLGALGRRAEEVFTSLRADQQSLARQMFLRLVTLGEGVEDTRRRVLLAEIESLTVDPLRGRGGGPKTEEAGRSPTVYRPLSTVIDSFTHHRLLSLDRDPQTRQATVEVAHEALLREWGRFRTWLDDSRADVRMQRQLALAAREWQDAQHDASFLLVGSRLEQFDGWAADTSVALTQTERSFLDASMIERDRRESEEQTRQQRELETAQKLAETEKRRAEEQTASVRRMRKRTWYIAGVLALAIIAAIAAGVFGQQANQNLNIARAANTQSAANAATAQAANTQVVTSLQTANQQRIEAENAHLAAEAYRIASDPEFGPELAALLSIRALQNGYKPEADAALVQAMPNLSTTFIVHPDPIGTGAVAYSPDGTTFATGQTNSTVQLWDAKTGHLIQTMNLGIVIRQNASFVSFSPDGKSLLVNTYGLKLIDIASGKTSQTYSDAGIFSGFSHDGKQVFATAQQSAYIWDTFSGKRIGLFSCPYTNDTPPSYNISANVIPAVLSSDGKFMLLGCTNGNTYLWDIARKEQVQVYKSQSGDAITAATFSPDDRFILTGSFDNQARLYDTQTAQLIRAFNVSANGVFSVAFSPDGKSILTTSWDNTTRLWDVNTGQQQYAFSHRNGDIIARAIFSPDGQSILTGGQSGEARIWQIHQTRLALNDPIARYQPDAKASFSPDGQTIITQINTLSGTSIVKVIQTATGHEEQSFEVPKLRFFTPSPDGKSILLAFNSATDTNRTILQIQNIKTGQLTQKLDSLYHVYDAAFSPDGSSVLLECTLNEYFANSGIQLWDIKSGNLSNTSDIFAIRIPWIRISNVFAWAPNGNLAMIAGEINGIVHVLDMKKLTQAKTLGVYYTGNYSNNTGNYIRSTAFSPDNKKAITGDSDGNVRLWDIEGEKELRAFKGHTSVISSVAFSPDGKYILSASFDKTVRLWDATSGNLLRILNHTQYVTKAMFSKDGKFILSNGGDGARLWDTDYHDTIRAACSLLIRDLTPEERAEYNITDNTPTCP